MKIKVSTIGYKNKPSANDIGKITNEFKYGNDKEVNYKELAELIKNGHSVLLADFKNNCCSIKEEFINHLECIALDIDSKENKITMYEMITLIYKKFGIYPVIEYCTFSDVDYSKFRLIYRLEDKVDVETYKTLYRALQWKFNKYLDPATKNANRIWAGTNKEVHYRENDRPITFQLLIKLIGAYENKLKRDAKRKEKEMVKYKNTDNIYTFSNKSYIKPEYKKEISDYLIDNISLIDFIRKYFGGYFKKNGNNWVGACSLHGGDNKTSLVVSDRIYTCFTHCGTGNLFTLAKKVYREDNFSNLVFKLASDYNLIIPKEYIREVE